MNWILNDAIPTRGMLMEMLDFFFCRHTIFIIIIQISGGIDHSFENGKEAEKVYCRIYILLDSGINRVNISMISLINRIKKERNI